MQTTLSELVESVSFALINSRTPDTELKGEIQRRLHEAQQTLLGMVDLPDFRVDASLSALSSSTTGIYELPDDFYRIIDGTVYTTTPDERTLRYYTHQDWVRSEQYRRAATGDPDGYTMPGRDPYTGKARVQLFPIPSRDYTVKYSYFAMPADVRDTDVDADVVDPRFPFYARDAIVGLTVLKFPQFIGLDQVGHYERELRVHVASIKRHTLLVAGATKQRRAFMGPGDTGRLNQTWPTTVTGTPFL